MLPFLADVKATFAASSEVANPLKI